MMENNIESSGFGSSGFESSGFEDSGLEDIGLEENTVKVSFGIYFAVLPLLVGAGAFVLGIIYFCIWLPIYEKIVNIKYNYTFNKERKKLPIYNCKLTNTYIKKLNKNNFETIKEKKNTLECAICIEEINIEKFKNKSTDLIFLNCGHVYHKNCLNNWVQESVNKFTSPNCPYCRDKIVNIEESKTYYINTNYDSDSSDGYLDSL